MADRGGKGKRNNRAQDKAERWQPAEKWTAKKDKAESWEPEAKGRWQDESWEKEESWKKEAPKSRWQPAGDRKADTKSDWRPVTEGKKSADRPAESDSTFKPNADLFKKAVQTMGAESAVPSSPAKTEAPASASSTLSMSAAAFVPGQSLSATAAKFVPSATAAAFVPGGPAAAASSAPAEFVPGQSWSSAAAEFVPGQAFVPGQSSWSGAPASGQAEAQSWQPNMYSSDFQPSPNAMYPNAGVAVPCIFNMDMFSDSDSSSSPSPRQPVSTATPTPAAKVEEAPSAAETPAAAKLEDGNGSTAKRQEAEVIATETPQASPDSAPAATPSTMPIPSPLASPAQATASSEFHSPASRAGAESPLMASTPTAASGVLRALEEPMSGDDDELGSFTLPTALDDDYLAEANLSAEMSERALKHWLQRFANESDTLAFSRQYHMWTDNGAGVAPQEVVVWLIRHGLDDCRFAGQVTDALDLLLRKEGLPASSVESAMADYSEEDLEDMQLDNPKAMDFVAAVKGIVENLPADLPLPVSSPKSRPAKEQAKPPEIVTEAPAPREDKDRTETYSPEALMKVRKALVLTGVIDEYTGPRWTTETAGKLFAPMPLWQQQRMSRGPQDGPAAQGSPPGGGEWRDAQKRNADRRSVGGAGGKRGSKQSQKGESAVPQTISETSWVAQIRRWKEDTKQADDGGEDTVVDEIFLRELRLTLNKLTVEKFDNLSDHLILLISQSTRPNRGIPVLMQLVFEKATTQHHFIDMYVNLCVKLHQWLMANNDVVRVESQTNFKRILLNQCQNSFEMYLEPPGTLEGLSGDSLYEEQVKYKTKMLGNIKLVGQLIRHGMLSPKIALSVAAELVRDDPMVREERLETLAVFLETIGPSLDDPNWSHSQQFETIFSEVNRLVNDRGVPNRIRFLLRDVLDLRRGKWLIHKARKFDEDAPTTLAEVHEKAKEQSGQKAKGGGRGSVSAHADSSQKNKKRGSTGGPSWSPPASPQHKPAERNRLLSSPGGLGPSGQCKLSPRVAAEASSESSTVRKPLQLKPKDATPKIQPQVPELNANAEKLRQAVAVAATRASKPKEEILADFHKEVTQIIRQVGTGVTVSEGVQRLRECSLPSDCVQEEVVDLIARMVDEPRERRQHMFPLLKELFDSGVFSPPGLLSRAVTSFVEDAFEDPGSVDPPDLVDIVLRELFPALGLDIRSLNFTPCVAEIFAEVDDGR